MTGARIRPVVPEEYAAVGDLTVSVYAEILGETLSEGYRVELADVARRDKEARVLVAVDDDGQLLGSVTYVAGPEGPYAEFEGADEAGIRMLVVAPQVQRQGVGTALMEVCLAQARSEGRVRVSLHTTAHMVAARRFYEKLGFHRAPKRDWSPESGVELLGYVLELDAAGG